MLPVTRTVQHKEELLLAPVSVVSYVTLRYVSLLHVSYFTCLMSFHKKCYLIWELCSEQCSDVFQRQEQKELFKIGRTHKTYFLLHRLPIPQIWCY